MFIIIVVRSYLWAARMRMGFPVGLFSLSAHSPASEIALSHCRTWTIPERSLLLHLAWALWSLGYCTAMNQHKANHQFWHQNTSLNGSLFSLCLEWPYLISWTLLKWKLQTLFIYNRVWNQHFNDLWVTKLIFTT